MYLFSKPMVIL